LQTAKASEPTVRGQTPANPPAAEGAAPEEKNDQKEDAKRLAAEVAKAKEKLAELQKQEDLLERQLALDKDTVYSNPDSANDDAGKARLDAIQQQIDQKLQAVSDAKAHLAELQSKLDQVAPAEAPTQPAPPQS
jgi:chromosome segregation ATPase